MPTELCFTPASQLARLIKARKLSATEVVKAFIAQIERVNPQVNAIVTFVPELALKAAKKADRNSRYAGLPIAYKDLMPTKSIRTTFGSLVFEKNVPAEDGALVERLSAAGVVTLGKTNTPEFGAGSQTFNAVFGATKNPYDLTKTCGGSSGGAAAAVASGMLPFADGGDLAASLRNPGNYCNVVGFRPTPGRVSAHPESNVWKLHPSIPEEIAAVHDPLGNAVHTALAGPVAGLRFAVFGCGPIGRASCRERVY